MAHRYRRWFVGGLALVHALSSLAGATSEPEAAATADEGVVGVWDFVGRADIGSGYRHNVLRSGLSVESSSYAQGTVEALLTRMWSNGAYVTPMLLAEGTRYFDSPSVTDEQYLSAMLAGGLGLGTPSEGKAAVSYLYEHQVLDASETEADLHRVLVKGHGLSLEPSWKWGLGHRWSLELGGEGLRQLYAEELDDYWEGTGRVTLSRAYSERSEIGLGYAYRWRPYDTRNTADSDGFDIPGTPLVYQQHELGVVWRHAWDAGRHWRSTTKLSGLLNRDNGSGYFDYDRLQFRTALRWANQGWDIGGTVRTGHYRCPVQRVGDSRRYRDYVVLGVSIERSLTRHWRVKLGAEWEYDVSNDPIDDYRDWACWAGVGYEF